MNGELIRERRKALGLTQDQLAERMGIVQSLIGMLESGERASVSLATLRRLAAVLEVSADDLLKDPTPAAPSAA